VDETHVKVAGARAYVYRALDEHVQVVDVYISAERATEDATAFFCRAIEAMGVAPAEVTTFGAAAYPPARTAVLHETGKRVRQRIEWDHQHLKGRVRGMRGFKTLAGACGLCSTHAFPRNLRSGCYDLGATLTVDLLT
jgi:transposase-like protein